MPLQGFTPPDILPNWWSAPERRTARKLGGTFRRVRTGGVPWKVVASKNWGHLPMREQPGTRILALAGKRFEKSRHFEVATFFESAIPLANTEHKVCPRRSLTARLSVGIPGAGSK